MIAFTTDFVLLSKERRKIFSNFLKRYSTPELFNIYGNPGEAAAAADHALTHTGVYDSISYTMNTQAGMTPDQAYSRLPDERTSAIEAFMKKDPETQKVDELIEKMRKVKTTEQS